MMLNPSDTATGDAKSLAVVRAPIEVVLSEDAASPLSLVLPPFEDIREITSLKESHFSIRDWSKRALASVWEPLHVEYESLLKKRGRFENSQILLNRLANISSIEGNLADERAHLRAALLIKHSEFLKNRLIDNLIAGRHDGEADALLAESDLATSIYANLRLASKLAIAGDIGAAVERVTAAVGIDPLDFGSRLFEGSLKLWQGDNEGAILSFRIASERRKNSAALYTNMAVAYVRMGRIDKASHSLRRAIAIEPLNLNAVTFLADLAFAQNRDEDSIPALRYLIQFEQKSSGVWGRLARALLRVGSTVEAIAAIKRQASLENSSEVWNNLGVAYHAAGEMQRSMESFKYAMQISSSVKTQGFCLAAKNIAALISRTRPSVEVLKFIEADEPCHPKQTGHPLHLRYPMAARWQQVENCDSVRLESMVDQPGQHSPGNGRFYHVPVMGHGEILQQQSKIRRLLPQPGHGVGLSPVHAASPPVAMTPKEIVAGAIEVH